MSETKTMKVEAWVTFSLRVDDEVEVTEKQAQELKDHEWHHPTPPWLEEAIIHAGFSDISSADAEVDDLEVLEIEGEDLL